MSILVVVLFLLGSIAEMYSLLWMGSVISTLNTISLTMFTLLLGVIIGRGYGEEWQEKMQWHLRSRSQPPDEVINGAVMRLGSAMLKTPGIITDFLGLIIIFPKTRFIAKGLARGLVKRKMAANQTWFFFKD